MPEATACPPSVVADTIMRTIELGVTITDAAVDDERTTIFCAPVARDPRCPDCGREGRYRDTVIRPLTDLPMLQQQLHSAARPAGGSTVVAVRHALIKPRSQLTSLDLRRLANSCRGTGYAGKSDHAANTLWT